MLPKAAKMAGKRGRVNSLNQRRRNLHNIQRALVWLRVRRRKGEKFEGIVLKVFILNKIA